MSQAPQRMLTRIYFQVGLETNLVVHHQLVFMYMIISQLQLIIEKRNTTLSQLKMVPVRELIWKDNLSQS